MAIINYIEKHLKTFNVAKHCHNFWEIISITAGHGKIETENNEIIAYKKGDIICIPPKLKHSNKSELGFKNIHLTLSNWNVSSSAPILIKHCSLNDDLNILLDLAYKCFHKIEKNNPLNIALTDSIIAMLDLLLENRHKGDNITQTIINQIINNYTDSDFNIESAYKLIPLSKEYIRKIFIKEHGISPIQFLTQKRIELAKRLLTSKSENPRIKEIANACGFSDAAYFSRIFKKETGISPNKFQLDLLENNKIYN